MQMRKRMWDLKRDLMQQDRFMCHIKNNSIEVRALVCGRVGHVVSSTLREIVHRIGVVGPIYMVHMRHKTLGMLVRVFCVSMQ